MFANMCCLYAKPNMQVTCKVSQELSYGKMGLLALLIGSKARIFYLLIQLLKHPSLQVPQSPYQVFDTMLVHLWSVIGKGCFLHLDFRKTSLVAMSKAQLLLAKLNHLPQILQWTRWPSFFQREFFLLSICHN